ncbi:MAG: CapA family protein, partial [Anaerolineales bacterium]
MHRSLPLIPVLLSLGLLGACSPTEAIPPEASVIPVTATPTPFQAPTPSPTPTNARVWLSPALPSELRAAAESVETLVGRTVELVQQPEGADLRLGPDPQQPLSRWVYAAGVAFPTIRDSIALSELSADWAGETEGQLLMTEGTMAALESRLGPGVGAQPMAPADQLQTAWADPGVVSIIPFDSLSPRWKVLEVDGVSPLDPNFDSAGYPLIVDFGASGDPTLFDPAAQALDWPLTNRDPEDVSMVAITGVTAITRATAWAVAIKGIDWAISGVVDWLRSADITHVSHEVSFTPDCPPVNPSRDVMRFCGQTDQIELLDRIGVDVIELTGNHVMDYGPGPMLYTLDAYDAQGWLTFGGGRNLAEARMPAIIEHHGNRFAFLGCNPAGPPRDWATEDGPGSTPCDMPALLEQIAQLRQEGALPIVTFQWNEAYRNWPLPNQADAFREAADAGAVIVSGSQAHQPMGFEYRGDSVIHYGLGNLFFDQM